MPTGKRKNLDRRNLQLKAGTEYMATNICKVLRHRLGYTAEDNHADAKVLTGPQWIYAHGNTGRFTIHDLPQDDYAGYKVLSFFGLLSELRATWKTFYIVARSVSHVKSITEKLMEFGYNAAYLFQVAHVKEPMLIVVNSAGYATTPAPHTDIPVSSLGDLYGYEFEDVCTIPNPDKMDKATLRALEKSIWKWTKIALGVSSDEGSRNCALCEKFIFRGDSDRGCKDCPVYLKTGCLGCEDTPYSDWLHHHSTVNTDMAAGYMHVVHNEHERAMAVKEVMFLASLIPENLRVCTDEDKRAEICYECQVNTSLIRDISSVGCLRYCTLCHRLFVQSYVTGDLKSLGCKVV